MSTPVKLKDIAMRISAHLARLCASKAASTRTANGFPKLHRPRARLGGPYVRVIYESFGCAHTLSRAEAERYLAALDAGFTGKHYELPQEDSP